MFLETSSLLRGFTTHQLEEFIQEKTLKAEKLYKDHSDPDFTTEFLIIDSVLNDFLNGVYDELSNRIDSQWKKLTEKYGNKTISNVCDPEISNLSEGIIQYQILEYLLSVIIEQEIFAEQALNFCLEYLSGQEELSFDLSNYQLLTKYTPLPRTFRILRNIESVLKRFKVRAEEVYQIKKP